ncbi:MAG: class I SAM-dependent methyltransferase [Acidobacteria bacterium]|nr:class I SAM-dependent methyltransferase [Acidobacteriota bacterium]MBV9070996.1 class I SAM-dependent methyltransferase [Acidobacteriota bacterium]MBV9184523.1 class I SAM-dependent methyltransferase [Acidobacteriota bacterium]
MRNVDDAVVDGFGDEWSRFDQSEVPELETQQRFEEYFGIFPWHELPPAAVGLDLGCGSGRWARLVAPRVGRLLCFDASRAAADVAKRMLAGVENAEVAVAAIDELPVPDASADFAYSLGVLHHIPDTGAALRACVRKVRPGAPFLVYLYYRFDNRPAWYQRLWQLSEVIRHTVSRSPKAIRYAVSQFFAATVYWPLSRLASVAERIGIRVESFPLAYYRNRSFYMMRTDALDRFGTRLEQRFTRAEIESMMRDAGLVDIVFSPRAPFWVAMGRRQSSRVK